MFILFPLLRRLPIRARVIVGSVLTVAGLVAVVAGIAGVAGIAVHGAVVAVVGLVVLGSVWSSRRRLATGAVNVAGR